MTELTIGPCCYKTKIGALLSTPSGDTADHYIWSEGDLTLSLLLPYLVERMSDEHAISINVLLPTVTRTTLTELVSLAFLDMSKQVNKSRINTIHILTRNAEEAYHILDDLGVATVSVYNDRYYVMKVHGCLFYIGHHSRLSTQLVTLYQMDYEEKWEKSYMLSGSLPQVVAASDQLLMLTGSITQYHSVLPYMERMKQMYMR